MMLGLHSAPGGFDNRVVVVTDRARGRDTQRLARSWGVGWAPVANPQPVGDAISEGTTGSLATSSEDGLVA